MQPRRAGEAEPGAKARYRGCAFRLMRMLARSHDALARLQLTLKQRGTALQHAGGAG